MDHDITINEGAGYFEPILWPWPALSTTIILEERLRDGALYLAANAEGRFLIAIVDNDGRRLREARSSVIEMEPRILLKMALGWNSAGVTLRLNGHWIVSTGGEHEVLDRVAIPATPPPLDADSFAEESTSAVRRRRDIYRSLPLYPGKVRRGHDEIAQALAATLQQMREAMAFIEAGRHDYVDVLAGLLRKVIADRNQALPLLQLVAAMHDKSLTVYGPPSPPREKMLPGVSKDVVGACRPDPIDRSVSPLDLDIWLNCYRQDVGRGPQSHKDVIWDLGSTRGSHFDLNAGANEAALRQSATEFGGQRLDLVAVYLRDIAATVVALGERVLAGRSVDVGASSSFVKN